MTEAILRRAKRRFHPAFAVAATLLVAAVAGFLLYRPAPESTPLEAHPEGPYADASCLELAGHYSKTGDDLSALACYASIRSAETITPEVARSIQETGRRAGRAFAGPRPLAEADLDALRRCAQARTPYGLVRTTPEGRTEIYLLGPVDTNTVSCAAPGQRRLRIDPAAPVADPVVRRMLNAMQGLAK
jgi:hypothetical protein